ncbi:hypothetical protein KPH14_009597 [Odynerus spinipes]|uniref:Thioredoxin domain-containing protein n=1 Tax=Odynerus spinipes TaxID=1348599 RepID=A0AAD9VQS3_9HYME|nr:hypothetical protein KPH14_009597 [Odynerus spinipes]
MVLLGETFPDFTVETQDGPINFYEWLGDSWGILFSHPSDFTPVCTTELARVAKLMPEFKRLGIKVIALSCNSVESHHKWIEDIKSYGELTDDAFPYPIIEDESRKLATMLDPAKKMRLSMLYPATTGRNFDEILRVIESLLLTDKHKVATPVDWKKGEEVMIQPYVTEQEAEKLFPSIKTISLPSGKTYLRMVAQPI